MFVLHDSTFQLVHFEQEKASTISTTTITFHLTRLHARTKPQSDSRLPVRSNSSSPVSLVTITLLWKGHKENNQNPQSASRFTLFELLFPITFLLTKKYRIKVFSLLFFCVLRFYTYFLTFQQESWIISRTSSTKYIERATAEKEKRIEKLCVHTTLFDGRRKKYFFKLLFLFCV